MAFPQQWKVDWPDNAVSDGVIDYSVLRDGTEIGPVVPSEITVQIDAPGSFTFEVRARNTDPTDPLSDPTTGVLSVGPGKPTAPGPITFTRVS